MGIPKMKRKGAGIARPACLEALREHLLSEHGMASVNRNLLFGTLEQTHRQMHRFENPQHTHHEIGGII